MPKLSDQTIATFAKSEYTLVGDWFVQGLWKTETPDEIGDAPWQTVQLARIGEVIGRVGDDYVVDVYPIDLTEGAPLRSGETQRVLMEGKAFLDGTGWVRLFTNEAACVAALDELQAQIETWAADNRSFSRWIREDRRNERRSSTRAWGEALSSDKTIPTTGVVVEQERELAGQI